jgi:hypothetical protein
MRKSFAAAAVLAVAAPGLVLMASAPAQAADDATLYVFHGVPDLTVDVYVNGDLTLDDFEPGTFAGPLDLPAGTYTVAITAADAADDSSPAIGPVDLDLAAGKNYTAAAFLDEAGAPTAGLFTNDISKTSAGDGRLTVRHTAAAPAVDLLAGGAPVAGFTDITNGKQAKADLPAGTVDEVAIAATGTTDSVLDIGSVDVAEGVNTIAYAWGSLADDNLAVAVQTIDGLHSAPGSVPAGEAGLADGASTPMVALAVGALAAFGALFSVRRLVSARS